MGNKVITIAAPTVGTYGGGGIIGPAGGAAGARDDAWEQAKNNDAAQTATTQGIDYANKQATLGQSRPDPVGDQTVANNQASGANGNQAGAIELARRQAMGQTPGASTMQLQQGLNQASAQQNSMAAGARGSAALSTAGANAAANKSNLQQNAFMGAGLLRSQDMAAGRGLYGSLTGQQRTQDGQALGMANKFGQDNAARDDAYSMGMGSAGVGLGGVAAAQNGQDLNYFNTGMQPIEAQDEANQAGQTWKYDVSKQVAGANSDEFGKF